MVDQQHFSGLNTPEESLKAIAMVYPAADGCPVVFCLSCFFDKKDGRIIAAFISKLNV